MSPIAFCFHEWATGHFQFLYWVKYHYQSYPKEKYFLLLCVPTWIIVQFYQVFNYQGIVSVGLGWRKAVFVLIVYAAISRKVVGKKCARE